MLISVTARVIAAGMLFWALDRHAYDYYVLLRWLVFAVAVYLAFLTHQMDKDGWLVTFGIVALLFNPIIPIHLSRNTWAVIDVAAGALMLLSILFVRRRNRQASSATDSSTGLAEDKREIEEKFHGEENE